MERIHFRNSSPSYAWLAESVLRRWSLSYGAIYLFVLLCMLLQLPAALGQSLWLQPGATYLEPAKSVSWWYLGEAVTFRHAGAAFPADIVAVEGVVANSEGKEVGRVTRKLPDICAKGWSWTPAEPGYYEVTFYAISAGGSRKRLERTYHVRARNGIGQDFVRGVQGFAVLPRQEDGQTNQGQFGFDTYSASESDLMLATLIGFDVVRLTAHWGQDGMAGNGVIEPVKGVYHWAEFDREVNMFSKAGLVINAQLFGTPRWATTHPEKSGIINICVDEGSTYAPKDMADWDRFVKATVARYKDHIHLWEIWNEPSTPGGSVFWADSTENYVNLLKTGYEAVKSVQPEGEVSIGGLGPRAPYFAFYNKVWQLGGGKYFDALSLHGFSNSVENFHSIEVRNGSIPKPAFNGEWHAILQGNMQSTPVLSERALSIRMMKDLLSQIKDGVSRTMFFELTNLSEIETIPFSIENKWFTHSSGLFRRVPQLEPRLPAVVMANFLDITGRKASCQRKFAPGEGIGAVELSTAKGDLLVFWSDKAPFETDTIKPYATENSVLRDWEGKLISIKTIRELEGGKLYYLTLPDNRQLATTPSADVFTALNAVARSSSLSPHAFFTIGKLFANIKNPASVPAHGWIQSDWKLTQRMNSAHAEGFSARAAVSIHRKGVDVVVEVHDKDHVQNEPRPEWWRGDSVQIGIDCEGNGLLGGNTEFLSALTANGPIIWKTSAADPHGDIPSHWSAANGPAVYAQQKITREGQITKYQIRIPWSELYPLSFDPAKLMHISFLVNNNDGSGRDEYLEWGQGIAKGKDPSEYGILQKSADR